MRDALIQFVDAEVRAEELDVIKTHRNSVYHRVKNGQCITGLRFEEVDEDGLFVYSFKDNKSKYRAGDLLVINDRKRTGDDVLREGVLVWLDEIDHVFKVIRLEKDGPIEPPYARDCTVDKGFFDFNSVKLKDGIELAYADDEMVALLEGRAGLPALAMLEEGKVQAVRKQYPELTLRQGQAIASSLTCATTMIQGPPGSGKTFLLALIIKIAMSCGKSVLVTAPTHKAIDNLLLAVAEIIDGPCNIIKIKGKGRKPELSSKILQTMVEDPCIKEMTAPCLIGSTIYQAYKLHKMEAVHFDISVIDEAGQMPIAHAMPAFLNANRYVIAGDHKQLPPVLKDGGAHPDFLKRSVFEHLHEHYHHSTITLDVTFRLNKGINEFPSQAFYDGQLRPSNSAQGRVFTPKQGGQGEVADIICHKQAVTFIELNHQHAVQRAPLEAELVAKLARDLLIYHDVLPPNLAIVSPHRAHNEAIRAQLLALLGHDPRLQSSVRQRLIIDTVERLQGQERDIIIFSLCASDREYAISKSQFLYSPNRLNVAITRSRKKLFLVGSRYFFPHISGILIDAGHLQLWQKYYEYLLENDCRIIYRSDETDNSRPHPARRY